MENKINIACFKEGSRTAEVKDIWQWDYGQILRIQGLNLPTAVEIHFSLDEHGGEAARRIGVAKDGVTDVVIPDSMVENESAYGDSYYFFAYIYLTDETSGNTEYKIRAKVSTRSKPEGYLSGGNDTFAAILKTVNEIADDKVTRPLIAKVGQVLSVKATDESGKPTEFEATDQGGGVSDEKIAEAVGTYMEAHPIEESDPTVPQWAKQPEKPSYTADEVGALPNTTTTLPNPNALTFTGAVTGSYDGSSPIEINIPEGGGTGVTVDTTLSVAGQAADAKATGDAISSLSEEKVDNPPTGAVGQILEIETVDENGKPKTYKAVNKPIGGGEVTDEQISNAVNNYMAANPIDESDPTVPGWAKQPEKPTYTASEVGALPDTTKIPSKTSDLQNDSGFLTEHQDLSGYALKSEVPKSASDVGADAAGTAVAKVSEHNTASNAHNDIRLLVQGLTERLNALADSDDTTLDQMSEVVAYIKSNKSLIDAITTSKVNVSDIIDNLTTNVSNKPLSAAQGVALKALIDAIVMPTKLSELENDSGYAKTTDIPDKLPNPQKLIFSGAVTAEYDGSGSVTVTIPEGSGGSGGTVRIEKLSTDTAVELEPNKLYVFPEMAELTITLAAPTDTGIANEYHFVFQSGATATTLTIPDTVKIPSGFTVDANKIYEISILESCLCTQSWEVTA